jgi:hypothetical protein
MGLLDAGGRGVAKNLDARRRASQGSLALTSRFASAAPAYPRAHGKTPPLPAGGVFPSQRGKSIICRCGQEDEIVRMRVAELI